jgi:outer membrane protein
VRIVRPILALALLALPLALTTPLHGQTGWTVRTRAVAIVPNASSTNNTDIDVKSDLTFEVDISRAFSPLLSVELILATAGHEVTLGGTSAGSVSHVPPTLLLQLHPITSGAFRPYIGAGGNFTYFYGASGGLDALDLKPSVGYAGQVGADFALGERGMFNLDAKYIYIKTRIENDGAKVADLKINPFVIGAGFGYRF